MKQENISFEEGIKKEWIITNGIGGYASSTIIGANTRRYHGLLVAPLTPPARRFLILSKIDESIQIDEEKYDVYTNIGKTYISKGYEFLESFEKEYVPIFTYKIKDVLVKKYVCMEYGKNTVTVLYRVFNTNHKTKLILTPIINFRDFHQENYAHDYTITQDIKERKVKLVIDGQAQHPIYINLSEGQYIKHENDSFKNMFYIEEEKRGFNAEENHAIAGRYEVTLEPNTAKDITFVASLEENIEEIDARKVISKEIVRIGSLVYDSELTKNNDEELVKQYTIATDNFIVNRQSFGLHTIIAGYPWFLDWGRDTLISFEGLLLISKRYDIAREVLLTMVRDVKYGLIPNGYSGYDNRPLYNSADASLLLFEQVHKYIRYTKDDNFVKENLYEIMEKIIEAYCKGIDVDNNNIYLDDDGLIVAGTEFTQNTWMDAKIGNYAVTPRNGKAVEINSMWYNALKIMEELTNKYGARTKANKYKKLADKCKKSFVEKFYNKRRKCLYDVLGDSKIRPNQLFALGLTYPVISPKDKIANQIFETLTKKLLNPYGLKTLAKGEENYVEVYEGDSFRRDMSYHQGITWPWLLGIYYDSFKKIVEAEKSKTKREQLELELNNFKKSVKQTFIQELENGKTIGGIHEIYDSVKPYEAKGAINQAWSIAEIFRIILD